jgi:hypothetical protein
MSDKYKDIAVGYINTDKNGKKYLAVTVKEDIKAGTKLFLRKNKFKTQERHPDYLYSVRVEPSEPPIDVVDALGEAEAIDNGYMSSEEAKKIADEIPF